MYCMLFWLQVLVAVPLVSNPNEAKTTCCTFFSSFKPNEATLALFFFLLSRVSCYLTPTLLLFPTWMGLKQHGSRHVFIFFYVFYIWHPPCRHAPHFQPKWGHFSSFFLLPHVFCYTHLVAMLVFPTWIGRNNHCFSSRYGFFLFDASVACDLPCNHSPLFPTWIRLKQQQHVVLASGVFFLFFLLIPGEVGFIFPFLFWL